MTTKNSNVAEGDPRFHEYADALRAGDMDTCERLRQGARREREITTKFDTLERMWLSEMRSYVREIQILRRERDGWHKVAEGKKVEGRAYLNQAEEARTDHEEPFVQGGFDGVK